MARHADPDPRHFWSSLAVASLRATLALALVVGLFAALAMIGPRVPEDGPVMLGEPETADGGPAVTREGSDESSDDAGPPDGVAQGSVTPVPREDLDTAIPATAPAPSETTVQVLDGVGASPALALLVSALEDLGYRVVATNPASVDYAVTTVLYSSGREEAARALQARDPRIVERRPNPGLSEQVDLHVVLGADWRP